MNDVVIANKENSLVDVIARAASDPNTDVTKLQALLNMNIQIMDKQAEIAFDQAMSRIQGKMPRITRGGRIVVDGKVRSTYARYEDIDLVIRPILLDEGFSLSFRTDTLQDGKILVTGRLSHKEGHFREAGMPLAIESSGSKNNVQGVGSTISYGKRYAVGMLLNIITVGEDDDGRGGKPDTPITTKQSSELEDLIKSSGADSARFLQFMGVSELDEIMSSDYQKAVSALKAKGKKP